MNSSIPFLDLKHQHSQIEAELKDSIFNVLKSNSFVLGECLSDFEKMYASYQQVSFCAGVGNGLDAVYLSLKALGIKSGDEVLVPSNTYIATWLAIERTGATIVPIEPNEYTYNVDVSKIKAAISPLTKCVLPVHLFGQACEMDAILEIANTHSLIVVEDNAQAHGATYGAKMTGSFGHINATSFYPTKNLGALGDGGAITTNSKEHYDLVCSLRNYGSTKKYINDWLGVNSRLDEIQAAVLAMKLKYLDAWNAQRRLLASTYFELLGNVGDLILPAIANGASHVYHVFTIRTNYRDALQAHLKEKGIETSNHYPVPPHLQKAFTHLGYTKGDFPIAEKLASTSLSLPIWPGLSKKEQEQIGRAINEFFPGHL